MSVLEQPPICRRCQSPQTELRRKVASNGTRMYAYQCLRCGENASGWVSHSKIPKLNLPDWDAKISEVYYASRAEEQRVQRELDRADWRASHNQYLNTREWRARRSKVLARARGVCEGCGNAPATQVHHLTYEHWQNEFLWELVAICEDCHERVHPHLERSVWPVKPE